MGTLCEGLFTFIIVSGWFLFRMRNVSDRVVGTIKTYILYSVTFFWKSCLLWDNVEKYCTAGQATDDNITWYMHFACWLTKATDIHSEYVILTVANMPKCFIDAHIACLVNKVHLMLTVTSTWFLFYFIFSIVSVWLGYGFHWCSNNAFLLFKIDVKNLQDPCGTRMQVESFSILLFMQIDRIMMEMGE
jgi:hypothetical protein